MRRRVDILVAIGALASPTAACHRSEDASPAMTATADEDDRLNSAAARLDDADPEHSGNTEESAK